MHIQPGIENQIECGWIDGVIEHQSAQAAYVAEDFALALQRRLVSHDDAAFGVLQRGFEHLRQTRIGAQQIAVAIDAACFQHRQIQ